MSVNYHLLKNSVVLNFDGETISIASSDSRFEDIVNAIKENRLDDIPSIVSRNENFLLEQGVELSHGLVVIDGGTLPSELNHKLLQLIELKLPLSPLVKFWRRLKLNPSFNSRLMLYKFLEHNGHPITSEGKFVAYRAVRNDFLDKHTGTIDNSVGQYVRIDRSQVDDNPNNTCSFGLHVATFDYAQNFASGDDKLLEVHVDPKDVVCVPTDYNGTKMRVCGFEVVAETKKMREEIVIEDDSDEEDYITTEHYDFDDLYFKEKV
jgi:hypothetical protein